jgi:hypothetical protein
VSAAETDYDARLALAEAELERLVRRLRSLSAAAWRERRPPVLLALGRLAQLTALTEQRKLPVLPELADHALADAVAVIGGDVLVVLASRRDDSLLAELIVEIRAAMDATR